MKQAIALFLVLSFALALSGCFPTGEEGNAITPTVGISGTAAAETETQNEVLQFLSEKYGLMFMLWGPTGRDLYVYHIYPTHADWECHILMPENTADIEQYRRNLCWKIEEDKLILSSAAEGWQETLTIDLSEETATSATTGIVYKLYEIDPVSE